MAAPAVVRNGVQRSHIPRKQNLYESRREREFYRYYEPIRALTKNGPPLCDLKNAEAVKAHRPFSSPDPALTAFCQLGALRLGTRRAMLFFFDSTYAYVLAEATRSLSLQDDSVHEIEDDLWLGHSIIPRGFSVCEETVCKPPTLDAAGQDGDQSLIHIINDLEKDVQFCDRPYVTDGPKARFYAGIPITTPKGIKIGAYCLLDDKARDGLDEKGRLFLTDIAKTVMQYLDACRARAEHLRGTKMVAGLGAFIEGARVVGKWRHDRNRNDKYLKKREPRISEDVPPPESSLVTAESSHTSLNSKTVQDASLGNPSINSAAGLPLDHNAEQENAHQTDSRPNNRLRHLSLEAAKSSDGVSVSRSNSVRFGQHSEDHREQLVATNVRDAFQRAAHLVRDVLGVEGTMFLDAAIRTYGGLVEAQYQSGHHSSDALASGPESTSTEGETKKTHSGGSVPEKLCKVLASSSSPNDRYRTMIELQKTGDSTNVTERFLRSLVRRHGHGKIWNFNEDGDASSDDESSELSARENGSPTASSRDFCSTTMASPKSRRTRMRIDDGREIQRLFPGVRSFILVGMWDQGRDRWFSACAIWTYSPFRMFSSESEVSFLAAFCDVVMAEVHRIEAQNSDHVKSDFISSISHELRSPLHGILGSAECLQELPTDSFRSELVTQIETCGRTLLSIVDHLLDYSKLNNLAQTKQTVGGSGLGRGGSLANATMSQTGGMLSIDTEVPLDEITEQAIETTVYSFCMGGEKQVMLERNVAVIFDVDRTSGPEFRCAIPLGGWKRICINLVSNALKYTSVGSIKVSLKSEPIPGKRKRFNVVFKVQDTGCGMTKDYLENHLFRPFSQENSLMEGSGLGMSLVAKIVKSMGGKIQVQSEKDVGTLMTVIVPVEQDRKSLSNTARGMALSDGLSVSIFGNQSSGVDFSAHDKTHIMLLKNLEHNCKDLGVQVTVPNGSMLDGDIIFVTEHDLSAYQHALDDGQQPHTEIHKPVVLLCNNAVSARLLRLSNSLPHTCIQYIAQPYGPARLRTAMQSCLDFIERSKSVLDSGPESEVPAVVSAVTSLDNEISSRHLTSLPKSVSLHAIAGADISLPNTSTVGGSNDLASCGHRSVEARHHFPIHLQEPNEPEAQTACPTGLSLLLVDDNKVNLRLLMNYASKNGHFNLTAMDGQQAVEAYRRAYERDIEMASHTLNPGNPSNRPQVILMDINMPVLDGFEATRQIRVFEQQHALQPARVIALTGLGSASAQQEAFSSGVDMFLTKPVRLKDLTKILDEIRDERASHS